MQEAICHRRWIGPAAQAHQVPQTPAVSLKVRFCLKSPPFLGSGSSRLAASTGGQWNEVGRRKVPGLRVGNPGPRSSLSPEVKESVDKFLSTNKVVVFMKGTKMFPQCGFSNTVVQILNSLNVQYETVNILEDNGLRQAMKEYSNWPTFPQLYIDGEFYGGCDITIEAYRSGELKEVLEKASLS